VSGTEQHAQQRAERSARRAAGPTIPVVVLTRTTPFMRLVAAAFRLVFRLVARVRVEGLELAPRSGPLIVVANHTTIADPPLVAAWLQPALGRPIQFMAKEQLFASALRPLLRIFGALRVRAGGSDVEAYRAGMWVLRGGGVLGLFPEGTRSADGVVAEPRAGVALLAARSGVSVLPVGVSGGRRLLPPGARLPRYGVRLTLRVGELFTVTLDPALDRRAATEAAAETIMRRVAALVEPEQRGRFG
jgi:1-acyl-sn-glycerol-3-phosphate acyltransferase